MVATWAKGCLHKENKLYPKTSTTFTVISERYNPSTGRVWKGISFSEHAQSCLTLSNSMEPIRLLCPWDFPGKNNGMGCHFLLKGIFSTQGLNLCLLHLLHWQVDSVLLSHLIFPGKDGSTESLLRVRGYSYPL